MFRRVMTLGLVVGMLGSSVWAQGEGWRFSAGAAYRSFGDIDVGDLGLSHPSGNFANGAYADDENYSILDESQLEPGGWSDSGQGFYTRNATFDSIRTASADEDADEAFGGVLEASRPMQVRGTELELVLGFGYFQSDTGLSAETGDGLAIDTLTGMLTSPFDPGADEPDTPYTVEGGAGYPLSEPTDMGGTATTAASVDMDAELNLLVLSAGLRKAFEAGKVSLSLGAGPTLNIADFDTSVDQTVTWLDDGSEVYSAHDGDNALDVKVGLYAAAGVDCKLTDQCTASLQARYDTVFGNPETDHAEISLDGYTIQALIGWTF